MQNVYKIMQEINQLFNAELDLQITGKLSKHHVYQLGLPSDILLSAGLPNLPIELNSVRLNEKSIQENHPYSLQLLQNLPNAIQNPLSVFRSATRLGHYVIFSEIQHGGNNFVVAVQADVQRRNIFVNDIRSVYPKKSLQVVNWINEGLLEYVDKEKTSEWLSKQRSNSADVRKLLGSATKVVQDFENPKTIERTTKQRSNSAEVSNSLNFKSTTKIIQNSENPNLIPKNNITMEQRARDENAQYTAAPSLETMMAEAERMERVNLSENLSKDKEILSDINKGGYYEVENHLYRNPERTQHLLEKYELQKTYDDIYKQSRIKVTGSEEEIYKAGIEERRLEQKLKDDTGSVLQKLQLKQEFNKEENLTQKKILLWNRKMKNNQNKKHQLWKPSWVSLLMNEMA